MRLIIVLLSSLIFFISGTLIGGSDATLCDTASEPLETPIKSLADMLVDPFIISASSEPLTVTMKEFEDYPNVLEASSELIGNIIKQLS